MNELKSSNEVSIVFSVYYQHLSKELSSLQENYVLLLFLPNIQKALVEKNQNAEMQISTLTQEKTTLFVRKFSILDNQSSVNSELRQQAEKNDELLVGSVVLHNLQKEKNEELESLKKKVEELKVLLAKAKVMIGKQVKSE